MSWSPPILNEKRDKLGRRTEVINIDQVKKLDNVVMVSSRRFQCPANPNHESGAAMAWDFCKMKTIVCECGITYVLQGS